MPSQSGAVMWAMPKVVRSMVTLREPPVGVLPQAPISALSATQLAVRRKRTTVSFRIFFMDRDARFNCSQRFYLLFGPGAISSTPRQTWRLRDVCTPHVLNACGGGVRRFFAAHGAGALVGCP